MAAKGTLRSNRWQTGLYSLQTDGIPTLNKPKGGIISTFLIGKILPLDFGGNTLGVVINLFSGVFAFLVKRRVYVCGYKRGRLLQECLFPRPSETILLNEVERMPEWSFWFYFSASSAVAAWLEVPLLCVSVSYYCSVKP